MTETTIAVDDPKTLLSIFGMRDQHLRRLRKALGVTVFAEQDQIRIQGEEPEVRNATAAFEQLKGLAERHGSLTEDQVSAVLGSVTGADARLAEAAVEVATGGRRVAPKTAGQARFMRAVEDHDLVLCSGPAGSGKTYLAVTMAAAALKREQVRKIVLVRPAVEAGESLGFLPGDMQAKIHPYLRPLLDALRELFDYEQIRKYTELDMIEVIPLAYMRGRTLNDAFIILDEAQNATVPQMKMFLTRMGRGSKIVVVGDSTQVDLPPQARSGLADAMTRLRGIEGVTLVELSKLDIVRHRLVQEIVEAYDDVQDRTRRR